MEKVYVTRCIVKKNGTSYKKGSVIKNLTDVEIEQGLAEHWLVAVGNDDDDNDSNNEKLAEKEADTPLKKKKSDKARKSDQDDLEKMTVDELIAVAGGLGLQTESSMPEETLREVIREARQ
jgi:co-chaperonin GroES (HSP10)